MIRIKRHIRQKCVAFLVVFFVIMTLKSFLEPLHLENDTNILGERFEYFAQNDQETHNVPAIITSDLKSKREVSHSQTVTSNPEKTSTISKCGYDVSSWRFLLLVVE